MRESAGGETRGWMTQQHANGAHSSCISHDELNLVKWTNDMLMRAASVRHVQDFKFTHRENWK